MNHITEFIFDLTVTDFLFLLFAVPSTLLFLLQDVSCSPIMPLVYVSFLFQLSVVSSYWGLSRLMLISIIMDMNCLCLLCCRCHLPLCLSWVLDSALDWAFFALITGILTLTFLCPSLEQGYCQVALISMYALVLLLFAAPVVVSRTIKFIKAKRGSQHQQPKRFNIVIFLILLFTLLLSLCNFLQQLGYIIVPSHVVFLLTCINSSIKSLICFFLGSCWSPCSVWSLRVSLRRILQQQKDDTAHRSDATTDTAVPAC